jgi:hypothetical protein
VVKDHKEPKELQVTHQQDQEAQREHHQQVQAVRQVHHHKDLRVIKVVRELKVASEHQHKVAVVQQVRQLKVEEVQLAQPILDHKDPWVTRVIKVPKDISHLMDHKGPEVLQVLMVHKGQEEQQVPTDRKDQKVIKVI